METQLGKDIIRKEAWRKVTGAAKYTDDIVGPDALQAKLLTSSHAHAKIIKLDISAACNMPGVKAVLTGDSVDFLCGTVIQDRPPLARDKVRYFGEPVAMVVADDELHAKAAIARIEVQYEPLPAVNSIGDAIKPAAVLVHENLMNYKKAVDYVYPIENSNICNNLKIRKGDMQKGWAESEVTVEGSFKLPQSDHAAMETRTARCKILPDGSVMIITSTQAPFTVKKLISDSKAKVMTGTGLQEFLFCQIFSGRLQLKKGEFLVQILIDERMLNLPYVHVKKTKMDKIDYPLITMAAHKNNAEIKAGVSGLGDAPFLLPSDLLSNSSISEPERIAGILEMVRPAVIGDILGSKEYRLFVLGNLLSQMYTNWK